MKKKFSSPAQIKSSPHLSLLSSLLLLSFSSSKKPLAQCPARTEERPRSVGGRASGTQRLQGAEERERALSSSMSMADDAQFQLFSLSSLSSLHSLLLNSTASQEAQVQQGRPRRRRPRLQGEAEGGEVENKARCGQEREREEFFSPPQTDVSLDLDLSTFSSQPPPPPSPNKKKTGSASPQGPEGKGRPERRIRQGQGLEVEESSERRRRTKEK